MRECPRCGRCYPDELASCPDDEAILRPGVPGEPLIAGRYEALRVLGRGGMGVVYVVRHQGLQREVALKLIQPSGKGDRAFEERFRREAEALGGLRHPNIVDVTDYGIDPREGGLPYLAMELLEGRSLSEPILSGEPMPLEEVLLLFREIAEGLDAAHASGVVHRDLKPDNIFLVREADGRERPKILDFGLVRWIGSPRAVGPTEDGDETERETSADDWGDPGSTAIDPEEVSAGRVALTRAGSVPGTLGYLAPEVLQGDEASPGADLYAFGVILYRALTGRLPHGAPNLASVSRVLTEDPPPPSTVTEGLPPEVDAPVLACLRRTAGERPRSAVRAMRSLEEAVHSSRVRRWLAGEKVPRRLAAALLGLVAGSALWLASAAERWTGVDRLVSDRLVAATPERPPNAAIELVMLDDEALAVDERPLAEQADRFSGVIDGLFRAGARTVVLDVTHAFADWATNRSWAGLVYDRHSQLVLAAQTDGSGRVLGTQAVGGLIAAALGPGEVADLFGFAEMDPDPDGIVRSAPAWLEAPDGSRWPSLATRAAERHLGVSLVGPRTFPVDHRVDPREVPLVSLADLDRVLAEDGERYREALVIFGASFTGSGDTRHRLPRRSGRPASTTGPQLQALIVDTLLAGRPLVRASAVDVAVPAGLLAAFVAGVILWTEVVVGGLRRAVLVPLLVVLALGPFLFALFAWSRLRFAGVLVPVSGAWIALVLVAVAAAFVVRRRPRRPLRKETP